MGFKNFLNSRFGAVATGSVAIALIGGSAGYAAGQIGSADIRDDSIRSVDIQDGTIRNRDLGANATPGERWSIVDRNVIGNGDSYLRTGPDGAPYGTGSLGLRTGSAEDKASFGNQVDFGGDPLSGIETVAYSVYTTGENNQRYAENGPSVTMEIDPTGSGDEHGSELLEPRVHAHGRGEQRLDPPRCLDGGPVVAHRCGGHGFGLHPGELLHARRGADASTRTPRC